MAAASRGSLPDRVWTAFVPRPSALRRRSDRVETAARWLALALLVLAVPVLLAVGSAHAQDVRDAAALERAADHPVTATVTQLVPQATVAEQVPSGTATVIATWVGPDATIHTVSGMGGPGVQIGEPWSAWVDASGHQVPAPATDGDAVIQEVLVAIWGLVVTAAVLGGALALLHHVLDVGRLRSWDENWAMYGRGQDHGMTG